MIIDLMKNFKNVYEKWENELISTTNAVDLLIEIICSHFQSFSSTHKRNKFLMSNNQFVAPVEKAIGTRQEMKKIVNVHGRTIRIPKYIQCTLQYVPILETLKSLFLCEEFASLYFEYNQKLKSNEIGNDGSKLYSCFNSGAAFAKNELFTLHPNSLQLQISIDDFEPCNPLQSKSERPKNLCCIHCHRSINQNCIIFT